MLQAPHLSDAVLGQFQHAGVAHSCGQGLLVGCRASPKHHLVKDVCSHGWQHCHSIVAQEHCGTTSLQHSPSDVSFSPHQAIPIRSQSWAGLAAWLQSQLQALLHLVFSHGYDHCNSIVAQAHCSTAPLQHHSLHVSLWHLGSSC